MSLLVPTLVVIAAWWVGTGVVLYLQQRINHVHRGLSWLLLSVALLSLVAMQVSSSGTAHWQSYLGFFAALLLWGCIELSYYTGIITGLHRQPCPKNCTTRERFTLALGASIWHEVSVLFVGGLVVTLMYSAENPTALTSFLVLWLMRWSAKLNLFFGVPNFNTDWFPKRLAYVHSYIRRSPVTIFFPASVLLASVFAVLLLSRSSHAHEALTLTYALPSVLLLLAILEHLFMALPIADSKLWNRIFAREDSLALTSNTDDTECVETRSAHRIQMRTQQRLQQVLCVSKKATASVKLSDVDATVQSIGRS